MSERKISCQISKKRKVRGASVPPNPLLGSDHRQLELTGSVDSAGRGRVGTIRILVEGVDRRGHASASLPDGTVLVAFSRQPFLDAARVLIRAGYDADSWLEAWWPHSTAFALRGRLRIAAGRWRLRFPDWRRSSAGIRSEGDGVIPGPRSETRNPACTFEIPPGFRRAPE